MRVALARTLMVIASYALPQSRAEWHAAMRAEFECLPENASAQLEWALGCAFAAWRMRLTSPAVVYGVTGAAVLAGLVYTDWNSGNDLVSLTVLLAAAGLLGWLRPKYLATTTAGVGGVLLVAHAAANFSGLFWPPYQYQPLSAMDFAVLASLLLPAFAAAKVGAILRAILPG